MSSEDAHQGGDLSDMAVKGTKIPNDAGQLDLLPSVPRPDQIEDRNDLGSSSLSTAADNSTDIPRKHKDIGSTGEVITGTGDQLPAEIESKRLHYEANDPLAKGHDRYAKHVRQGNTFDKLAGEGAEVDEVPGEEGESQDAVRPAKGA